MEILTDNQSTLRDAWTALQQAKPGIRIREAAKELGTSEAQLVATKTGDEVIRLAGPWPELLKSFKTLGRVMSLTRNDACILEHKGTFQDIDIMEGGMHSMATVIGPIETRVFFQAWNVAFAVVESKSDRVLKSIQIFGKEGDAITKIYLQDKSDEAAYYKIIEDFRAQHQFAPIEITPYQKQELALQPDTEALLKDWENMTDTHQFFGILRRHKVDRHHAMELASGKFATQIDHELAPTRILEAASSQKLPIMIFAGNRGNLQIHQGKVRTVRILDRGHTGPERWVNILDPDFNMHLKQNDIASAWWVRKPTADGDVNSVELFNHDKELIVQFFGLRKPGLRELDEWTKLVGGLPGIQK